ncbi:hypothetical protein CR513_49555, partial [Mucuna pruriens]
MKIGYFSFQISFQVIDIRSAYNCLLEGLVKTVSSPLHQKLKFMVDDKLVIVYSEEDILVSCLKPAGYIEVTEEALEISFQSLEIISTACVEMGSKKDKPTNAMITITKIMLKKGYKLGQGPGKISKDMAQSIQLMKNTRRRIAKESRIKSLKATKNLYENFINGGFANQVEETTKDQEIDDPNDFVHHCISQEDANEEEINWEPLEELKKLVELEDRIIQPYQEGI